MNEKLLQLSANIVAAHVGHNQVSTGEIPGLIRSIYAALGKAGTPTPAMVPLEPTVQVKKSVFPDYIVCLEDGKKLKMLKRHLQSSYGLSPDQYRAKWGLPVTYPMVAPEYAARRSTLAKDIGLGRKAAPPAPPPAAEVPVQKIPAAKRGRPAKLKRAEPVGGGNNADSA